MGFVRTAVLFTVEALYVSNSTGSLIGGVIFCDETPKDMSVICYIENKCRFILEKPSNYLYSTKCVKGGIVFFVS